MKSYIYISMTVLGTLYSQVASKWHMARIGHLLEYWPEKLGFLGIQLMNSRILSGLAAAFLAALSGMRAMTRFDLSYA